MPTLMTLRGQATAFHIGRRQMLAALTADDIRSLQRQLRGTTVTDWLAWRRRAIGHITNFMERFPDRLRSSQRQPDVARVMKLAAWQLCLEYELLFDGLARTADRKCRKPLTAVQLVARGVLEIYASTEAQPPVLWPFEIGSPFRTHKR